MWKPLCMYSWWGLVLQCILHSGWLYITFRPIVFKEMWFVLIVHVALGIIFFLSLPSFLLLVALFCATSNRKLSRRDEAKYLVNLVWFIFYLNAIGHSVAMVTVNVSRCRPTVLPCGSEILGTGSNRPDVRWFQNGVPVGNTEVSRVDQPLMIDLKTLLPLM